MSEPVKQYVNLDPSKAHELREISAERAGRRIKLTAKLNKEKEGIPVVFEIVGASNNAVVNLGNYSAKHRSYLKKNMQGLDSTGRAKRRVITNEKGEAIIEFILSVFGGDVFEVKAYVPKQGGKAGKVLFTKKYVTWRRIYYQVSCFEAGKVGAKMTGSLPAIPDINWESVEKEFAATNRKHYVELVREDHKPLIKRYFNVLNTNNKQHMIDSALDGYKSNRPGVSMRCVMVNMIGSYKEYQTKIYKLKLQRTATKIQTAQYLWQDESLPRGEDCVIDAVWRVEGGGASDWRSLDRQILGGSGPSELTIYFDELSEEQFSKKFGGGKFIEVLFILRRVTGSINGLSWYNSIWVANQNMHSGPRPEDQKQSTAVHEAGHFVDLTSDLQKSHYTGKGHQGPHCSTGLSKSALTKDSYRGLSGTCVMFGESAKSRHANFCPECDKALREASIRVKYNMPNSHDPADWDMAT